MAGCYFKTYRNSSGLFSYLIGKISKIFGSKQIGKSGRTDGRFAFFQPSDFSDFTSYFISRKMSACTGFCALPALKMKGLCFFDFVPAKLKTG